MDDVTITTVSHIQARWVLEILDDVATWARMSFKASKSRSMIIKKGKVTNKFCLKIQEEIIPSIEEKPVKCLGKWFDASLKDGNNINDAVQQAEDWLKKIEKSDLSGKFKVWLYQHGLLPRLVWLFTIYEFPITTVELIERKVSKSLRRWLGVPPGFTSVGLYMQSGQLQLPISSAVEEYKVAKCRNLLCLRDSEDKSIRQSGIVTRSGRKWAADKAVEQAENALKLRDIIGIPCIGRQGFGSIPFQQWSGASKKTKQAMIQSEVRSQEEERRRAKAVGQGSQGAWTKWDLPSRKLTWEELWRWEPLRISFLLRSVYDTLPSPSHLHMWGVKEDPNCKLCGQRGTLAHILTGCKTSLSQGRYTWRHDKVLLALAHMIEQVRTKNTQARGNPGRWIEFVPQGSKPASAKARSKPHLLQKAQDWELRVDVGKRLKFPDIVTSTLRPDIVLWSEKGKKIIMIELTVPWEEGCEEAHERKALKYQPLLQECRDKGWQAWLFPVEVGCRGFPAKSVWQLMAALGLPNRDKRKTARRLSEEAERASSWIWHRREEAHWRFSADG